MKRKDFIHKKFFADKWECLVKDYICNLDCDDNKIWYKKNKDNKKIKEELITLGYYVKYRFDQNNKVSFRLNKDEGKEDGWVYEKGKEVESIQIVIAYYDTKETKEDYQIMKRSDSFPCNWVEDRIFLLKERIVRRVEKKIDKKYENIDVLLVGVDGCFVKKINGEYKRHKDTLLGVIKNIIEKSMFKEIAIVDTDLAERGELLRIPNKTN